MIESRISHFRFILIVFTVLLFSCGGDDEVVDETTSQADEPSTPALDKPEVAEVKRLWRKRNPKKFPTLMEFTCL